MADSRISDLTAVVTPLLTDVYAVVQGGETKKITLEQIKDRIELLPVFTIELIDVLTVDFYAPFDMQINTVVDLVNLPTTTLEVGGVAYVLGDPINAGDKITVTVDTAAVVQLNAERI
jgi:hypothetical protein